MKATQKATSSAKSTTETPTPEIPKPAFNKIVYLCSRAEALAIKAQRSKEFVPDGFSGKEMICQVNAGFDRSVLHGARAIGFTLSCNLVDAAVDGVEIPIKGMNALQRGQSARKNTAEAHQALVEEALKEAIEIPAKTYKCEQVVSTTSSMEIEEL